MITLEVTGLSDLVESLRRLPTSLNRSPVFEEVAQQFSARLRAATPVGYSEKLKDSVLYEVGELEARVGYEPGVETAGDESLDSVLQPRQRGRTVLSRNWVRPLELEVILQETLDAYTGDAASVMESRLAEGLNGLP